MEQDPPADRRWLMLGVLFAARTVMACQFQTVGSSAPFLAGSFAIDFTQLGTLIGLYMLPGVFVALPGGVMAQSFGAKRIVITGLLLMAAGGAMMGGSPSHVTLFAGRLISGAGAVLINVMMVKMVADWFARREIVTAMAVLIASWPLGLGLALVLFPPLAAVTSWRVVMHAAALLALGSMVAVGLIYRDPPDVAAAPGAGLRLDLTGREWLAVLIAGSVWTSYNVAYIVLVSFLPEFFTGHGYSLAQAGWIVSLLGWFLIPSVPLAGWLAERFERPNLFLVGGFVVSGLAAAALPFVPAPIYVFGILALAVGAPGGLIMAMPAQVLRAERRAGGMGVYFTWYYVGMATMPGLAGFARDVTASAAAPPLFAAAMMALALAGLIAFRLAQTRV